MKCFQNGLPAVKDRFPLKNLIFYLFFKNADFDRMLRQLQDMGVEEGAARVALSSCGWDLQKATEQLFNWVKY